MTFLRYLLLVNLIMHQSMADEATFDHELMKTLLTRVDALESRDRVYQERVAYMESRDQVQKARITQLEEEVKRQAEWISKLDERVRDNVEVADQEQPVEKHVVSTEHDEKDVIDNRVIEKMAGAAPYKRQAFPEIPVAFFATLTNHMLHMGPHQNIIFDHVETNIGNAYHSHQGVFIAPEKGTYVFSSSILAFNNEEVWVDFVVNGEAKARMYARGTDNRHDQGAASIIVSLNAGDDVSVQSTSADDSIYGEPVSYTMFSGFLLMQE